MQKKSFKSAILAAGVVSLLAGCSSVYPLVPPQSVGNGKTLEGPVVNGPSQGWQPYSSGQAPVAVPAPTPADPSWRSAAVAPEVRSAPLPPVPRAEPVDPAFSNVGPVRERIAAVKGDQSAWGTYAGGGAPSDSSARPYSSRPDRAQKSSNVYSPWADRIVPSSERAYFDRMVMEATRTGGSRLTLRDGRYLAADRVDVSPGRCITVVVRSAVTETAPPSSTGEATVCG